MMRERLRHYDEKYPDIVLEILDYFSMSSDSNQKSIMNFCLEKSIPPADGKERAEIPQPQIVKKICDILCDNNMMDCLRMGIGPLGADSNYVFTLKENINREIFGGMCNSIVYGFGYVYDLYKNSVMPILVKKDMDKEELGTGFKLFRGIVTAKHCLEGAKSISIKGYSEAELNNSKILIHPNENVDLAFINVGRTNEIPSLVDDINIMDEILVMGYPLISQFHNFVTAEKATVSSIAESRLTPTIGSVASISDTIWRTELMLITAKIRGGNSGGPIINKRGAVVGVAFGKPEGEGNYDDLGYGIAIPIKYLGEILNTDARVEFGEKVNFVDCEE